MHIFTALTRHDVINIIGGSWDNSDVKGAKKKRWLASDKEYADGGYKKAQSVSILGEGQG